MSDPAAAADDWRVSVKQSYRNGEVREIAQVLASLEPGATSTSKLRLAMQFEDAVFKGATSLADYRKKLTKRLKKLQKAYVPPSQTPAASTETEIQRLRAQYGDALRYIRQHGGPAVAEMKIRHGPEKAAQLKQHIDGIRHWMADLGMLENQNNHTPPRSAEHLAKLKQQLERRVENIRSHVVKLADPNEFLRESLVTVESTCRGKAAKLLGLDAQKRYAQMHQQQQQKQLQLQIQQQKQQSSSSSSAPQQTVAAAVPVDPNQLLQESLQILQRPVPVPTRQSTTTGGGMDETKVTAALVHLDKLRAASTTLIAYGMIIDKAGLANNNNNSNTATSNQQPQQQSSILSRTHGIVFEGVDNVRAVVKEHRKHRPDAQVVKLADAWLKPLVFSASSSESTNNNRSKHRVVTKCRVLLTSGRSIPPAVTTALRAKGVTMVPRQSGGAAALVLQFGQAFVMTIYLSPLLVTLRACPAEQGANNNANENRPPPPPPTASANSSSGEPCECPKWSPLHQGLLMPSTSTSTSSSSSMHHNKSSNKTNKPNNNNNNNNPNNKSNSNNTNERMLSVWGTHGTHAEIGKLVHERLRDASTHATHVLRQCFATTTTNNTQNDLEHEIVEFNALHQFLSLARTTYMPQWQDVTA